MSMRRGRERKRTREVKNAKGKRAESVKPSLQSSFSLEGFLCLKCRRHGGLMVRVVGRGGVYDELAAIQGGGTVRFMLIESE